MSSVTEQWSVRDAALSSESTMRSVELIYRSGCPHLELARAQLRRALAGADLPPIWREWCSDDGSSPEHVRELPSPTFRVGGVDVCTMPASVPRQGACRIYRCGGARARLVPAVSQITGALCRRADSHGSDEALMAGYQRGDGWAFEELFERYQPRLAGYFRRRFGDRELAADLSQRTMLRVHRARHGYDPSRPFASWVFSIAVNLAKDELKRRGRRPGDVYWSEPDATVVGPGDPERRAVATEECEALRAAMRTLPEAQRDVIVLHKLEGRSFPEIANALGEQVEAVKSRAFRGYRSLRESMEANRIKPPCCSS